MTWNGVLVGAGSLGWIFSAFMFASIGWHLGKPKWARPGRVTRIERVDHLHIGEHVTPTHPERQSNDPGK